MTNNTIIFNSIVAAYTPEEIHELVTSALTPEHIEKAAATMTVEVEGMDPTAALEAVLAADLFHTFQYWKSCGYSVKKGEHAAITCGLWKYTDKPSKAAREAAAALPEGMDKDPEHDPHFYITKSHLFHIGQVQKSDKATGKKEYNEMLAAQRVTA